MGTSTTWRHRLAGPDGFSLPSLYSIIPGLDDSSGLVSEADCTSSLGTSTPAGTPALEWNGGSNVSPATAADAWTPSGNDPAQPWPAVAGDWSGSVSGGTLVNGSSSAYGGTVSPNGSTDGKDANWAEVNLIDPAGPTAPHTGTVNDTGCFNVGRSSSSPSLAQKDFDTAGAQYFAYALDALSVIVGEGRHREPPGRDAGDAFAPAGLEHLHLPTQLHQLEHCPSGRQRCWCAYCRLGHADYPLLDSGRLGHHGRLPEYAGGDQWYRHKQRGLRDRAGLEVRPHAH